MLSLCPRSRAGYQRYRWLGVALGTMMAATPTTAAEYYIQPTADLNAQVDTNLDLVVPPDTHRTEPGYGGDVGATIGVATPASELTLLPELGYADYPDSHTSATQEQLDFTAKSVSPRDRWNLWGRVDHRDTFSSELASATFDPLNPNVPTTPETGRIAADSKRTIVTVTPSYSYDLTPRTSVDVGAVYESAVYSGTSEFYTNYQYPQLNVDVGWALNPNARASLGVYGSRYAANNGSSTIKAEGATLSLDLKHTQTFKADFELSGEHDVNDTAINGAPQSISATGLSAAMSGTWKFVRSQVQLNIGRSFTPSGAGGKYRADQFQVDYSYDLTPRLTAACAARIARYVEIASARNTGNYDYVNATAGLKWSMTRTWYVGGGIAYVRESFLAQNTAAADNSEAYLSIGYRGLGRRQ